MIRTMLKSKLHGVTVTQADLHYTGSITIDRELMDAADLLPHERVDIYDITNGARLSTYVIEGEAGSGVIGINGAAAHLVKPGDKVIVASYVGLEDAEARALEPKVCFSTRKISSASLPACARCGDASSKRCGATSSRGCSSSYRSASRSWAFCGASTSSTSSSFPSSSRPSASKGRSRPSWA